MKWLLTFFMFLSVGMGLISCSKKDDSGPSIPSCYSGNYVQQGNQWFDPRTGMPVNCSGGGGQFGNGAVCLTYTDQSGYQSPVQVQSCGGNGSQPMGRIPDGPQAGQCIPAYYCNQW